MAKISQEEAVHLLNQGIDIPTSRRKAFSTQNKIQQLISKTESEFDKRVESFSEAYIKGGYEKETEAWRFLFLTMRHAFADAAKNHLKGRKPSKEQKLYTEMPSIQDSKNLTFPLKPLIKEMQKIKDAERLLLKEHIKKNTAPLQEAFTRTVLDNLNIQQRQTKAILFDLAIKEAIHMMDYICSETAHNLTKNDKLLLEQALESVVFEMEYPGTIRENGDVLEKALHDTAQALGEDYTPQFLRLNNGKQDLNEQEKQLKKALEHAAGTLKLRIATITDSGSHVFLNTVEAASIPLAEI